MANWNTLDTAEFVDLEKTLLSGQVFVFKKTDDREYTGVVGGCLVCLLQNTGGVSYKVLHGSPEGIADKITYFFTLEIPFLPLLKGWGLDEYGKLNGLRTVRYELVPTIFSFICSSNNNITRITRMVDFLCSKGAFIMRYKGIDFHHFPELEKLIDIEDELRRNKFGYRSGYICDAARFLMTNYAQMLCETSENTRKTLISLRGIGNKVADCILLIGMGDLSVVPVDTHILNFAKRYFGIKIGSLTDKKYKCVQVLYKERFGEYAGIAQLYIFKGMLDMKTSGTRSS